VRNPRLLATLAVPALAVGLSACQAKDNTDANNSADQKIQVVSTDDACDVSSEGAPSGHLQFSVKNEGSQVTEFYFYGEDGKRIVGEVENIGPGLSRDLVVRAAPGKYVASCRPGMSGDGIRSDFSVSDSGEDVGIEGVDQDAIDAATHQYALYVEDQASQLVDKTKQFTAAYVAGDDAEARRLYPLARTHWEGIETVAESFGDLDPKTDLREADLEPGQKWTGWHRLEKDLWPPKGYTPMTPAERRTYAADLMENIRTLDTRVEDLTYTVDQISNGSKGLLDEVATGKITGEEDIWSHTDLWDFQGNVDGARVAYETLKPLLEVKDPALSKEIAHRFTALQKLLDRYRVGADGFVFYDTVDEAQRKKLATAVDALSEPLSKMTGALTL
jgi:iron uptake system component EfeO